MGDGRAGVLLDCCGADVDVSTCRPLQRHAAHLQKTHTHRCSQATADQLTPSELLHVHPGCTPPAIAVEFRFESKQHALRARCVGLLLLLFPSASVQHLSMRELFNATKRDEAEPYRI